MTTPVPASSSFVKDYVDTTAPIGTFLTGFRFYVSIFIFLILIGFAIYLFFYRAKDNKHTESVDATVIKSSCNQSNDKNKSCDLTLEYMVGSEKYRTPFRSSVEYLVGQTISIYYDPNKPLDISQDSPTTDKVGAGILLFLGLLIVAGAYFSYWLSQ